MEHTFTETALNDVKPIFTSSSGMFKLYPTRTFAEGVCPTNQPAHIYNPVKVGPKYIIPYGYRATREKYGRIWYMEVRPVKDESGTIFTEYFVTSIGKSARWKVNVSPPSDVDGENVDEEKEEEEEEEEEKRKKKEIFMKLRSKGGTFTGNSPSAIAKNIVEKWNKVKAKNGAKICSPSISGPRLFGWTLCGIRSRLETLESVAETSNRNDISAEEWTVSHVKEWVAEDIHTADLKDIFDKHYITGYVLVNGLSMEQLEKMGVTRMGKRIHIYDRIQQFDKEKTPSLPDVVMDEEVEADEATEEAAEEAEREEAEREEAEREELEREKAEREKAEREKVEREKAEREEAKGEGEQELDIEEEGKTRKRSKPNKKKRKEKEKEKVPHEPRKRRKTYRRSFRNTKENEREDDGKGTDDTDEVEKGFQKLMSNGTDYPKRVYVANAPSYRSTQDTVSSKLSQKRRMYMMKERARQMQRKKEFSKFNDHTSSFTTRTNGVSPSTSPGRPGRPKPLPAPTNDEDRMKEIMRILSCGNHYSTLGVPWDATNEQINRAFKGRSRYSHTDKNPRNVQLARKAFDKLSVAKACLIDPQKRKKYDGTLGGNITPDAKYDFAYDVMVDEMDGFEES